MNGQKELFEAELENSGLQKHWREEVNQEVAKYRALTNAELDELVNHSAPMRRIFALEKRGIAKVVRAPIDLTEQ